MKKLFIMLVAGIVSAGSLHAQKSKSENWQKIAEATVDFKADKDKIPVSQAGNYKSVRIKTIDAPVHIDNLIVDYEEGGSENIPIRFDFKAGVESRAINLENVQKRIKEISIVYRTVPNWKGDKAQVEIWGLK